MRVDLDREPSENMRALAIQDYGERLSDAKYAVFAMLIARGEPAWKAYQAICFGCSDSSARSRASVLMAHDDVRRMIDLHAIGAQTTVRSLVPEAVATMRQLMRSAKSEHVRMKAAADIQDRGGLPRSTELAISAVQVVHAMVERHTTTVAAMAPPPARHLLTAGDRSAASARERETWQQLTPAAREPIIAGKVERPRE